MLSYDEIFLSAWGNILKKYNDEGIEFLTEADLQSHVFSECLKLMATEKVEKPYKIHANKSIFSPRQKNGSRTGRR